MKLLRLILIAALVSACSTPKAYIDYDEKADFSNFRTYDFAPQGITGLSELDARRILQAVENQMPLSRSEQPDLELNLYAESFDEPNDSRFGIGVGGGGGPVGVGVSAGIPVGGEKTILRLTFDLVAAKAGVLVWQAVVETPFDPDASPEERQEKFERIVKEAFKEYPPSR